MSLYCYDWKLGNYVLHIKSSFSHLYSPFYEISPYNNLPICELTIFLQEKKIGEELFTMFRQKGKRCIPEEIQIFYDEWNKQMKYPHDLSSHVNRYYVQGNTFFASFPYESDEFYFSYSYDSRDIYLYGSEDNLYRILMDLITVTCSYLPLHASFVVRNKQPVVLISDSNCGKTSLVLQLLKHGFHFLGDDSVAMDEDGLLPLSKIITVRKEYPNHPAILHYIKSHKKGKVPINLEQINCNSLHCFDQNRDILSYPKFFFLQEKSCSSKALRRMREPFPCLAHHSFWCFFYLFPDNKREQIHKKIQDSLLFWEKKIQQAEQMTVDFYRFEEFTKGLIKKID